MEEDIILPLANPSLSNEVPYISTYYIKPVLKPNEDNILNFYVSDFENASYTLGDDSHRYKVIITRQDKEDIVLYNLHAGDHEVNLGSYAEEGEYEFSIIARDEYGRFSHELFNFIKVSSGTVYNTYHVTEQDLIDYGIKYNNNREIQLILDCTDIFVEYTESADRIAKMKERTAQAAADYDLPEDHYVVAIPDRAGTGVYQGKNHDGRLYQTVRYADGYDKEAVELECNNTRLAIQKLLNDKRAEGYNRLVMYKAMYVINANGDATPKEQGIRVPNGMDLDLNGSTIKLNPFIGNSTIMMHISDSEDTHLHNGIIEGDYFAHDYANSTKNSEWVNGVDMGGACKYCSIYDLVIKDITGYGLTNGLTQRGDFGYTEAYPASAGTLVMKKDIDQTTGEEIEHKFRSTTEMKELFAHSKKWSKYISCSYYLGYQGVKGGTWNIIVHFYDKDKKYIKSINAHQYRRIRVPDNAWYARYTLLNLTVISTLSYQYFNVPTHCTFRDIKIDNARCVGCAPAQMKDCLFENIEFVGSGQCSANCAFDAEDGWDGMQDVTFRNLYFHDNPNNNFLTCAGHNFIIEDCPSINKIYIWARTRALVVRNTTAHMSIGNDGNLKSYHPRVVNCVATNAGLNGSVIRDSIIDVTGADGWGINAKPINCEIIGALGATVNANGCTFTFKDSSYLSNATIKNSIIKTSEGNTSCALSFNSKTGVFVFENVTFKNTTALKNHNQFYSGTFTNCIFEDGVSVQLLVDASGTITKDNHVKFTNCKFNKINGAEFAKHSPFAYSVGTSMATFENCEFEFTENVQRIVYGYSQANAGSQLTFKNCNFKNWHDNMYAFVGSGNNFQDIDLTITFENCTGVREDLIIKQDNSAGKVKIVIK